MWSVLFYLLSQGFFSICKQNRNTKKFFFHEKHYHLAKSLQQRLLVIITGPSFNKGKSYRVKLRRVLVDYVVISSGNTCIPPFVAATSTFMGYELVCKIASLFYLFLN